MSCRNSTYNITERCNCYMNNTDVDYFSLAAFNYCILGDQKYLTWPILIIVLLLCFYFISTTGNDYLAEALGIMSEKLKLSQNLAGLTLLALGNTAPDVAVAIVSGDDDNGGIATSLSSVLGGGSMVIGFVLSSVIFLGNGVSVSGFTFIRDLFTYFIILVFILTIGLIYREMNIFIGLVILCSYILYVVICIYMEPKSKKNNDNLDLGIGEDDNSSDGDENENEEKFKVELFDDDQKGQNDNDIKDNKTKLLKENDKDDNKIEEKENENEKKIINNIQNENNNSVDNSNNLGVTGFRAINIIKEREGQKKFNLDEIIDATYYGKIFEKNEKTFISTYTEMLKKTENKYNYALFRYYYLVKSSTKWEDKSIYQKIFYILVDYPFDLIRNLSIPPFEKKRYNKTLFIFLPVTIPLALTFIFLKGLSSFYYKSPYCWILLAYYILALASAVFLYFTTYRTNLPNCEWILLIGAFLMSILWIFSITNILVQMIQDAKELLPKGIELSSAFLVMTILAVGNSIPDFIVNCSLAKSGYAEMALSGSIGAPIFGMTIGFGSSVIKKSVMNGINKNMTFSLIDGSQISHVILCAFAGLILNLTQNMILGAFQQYYIKRTNAYVGYTIFSLYIISICIFSFFIK